MKVTRGHIASLYFLLGHTPGFTVIQTHDREAISLNAECVFHWVVCRVRQANGPRTLVA